VSWSIKACCSLAIRGYKDILNVAVTYVLSWEVADLSGIVKILVVFFSFLLAVFSAFLALIVSLVVSSVLAIVLGIVVIVWVVSVHFRSL
jgi:hypothetical protein